MLKSALLEIKHIVALALKGAIAFLKPYLETTQFVNSLF